MNPRYLFPRIWINWTPKPFRRYNFRQWALPEGVGVSWLGKDWTWSIWRGEQKQEEGV